VRQRSLKTAAQSVNYQFATHRFADKPTSRPVSRFHRDSDWKDRRVFNLSKKTACCFDRKLRACFHARMAEVMLQNSAEHSNVDSQSYIKVDNYDETTLKGSP
jgi:hypothetical protein